ncbi:MAG: hypothetical protein P8Z75_16235 [Gammaproteobacteria bacterium]
MIVVAILGIIAAIAIPAYKGYISTGHKTQCQNEVASIKLAESEYFLENNKYFLGGDVATLQSNSGSIYTPSKTANGKGSIPKECDYAVTSTDSGKTNYLITATGAAGGHLTSGATIVKYPGP